MADAIQDIIEKAARAAGEHIMLAEKNKAELKSWQKADETLVTNLDLECDQIISDLLAKHAPILTEEKAETYTLLKSKDPYFLVDPLDGTTACKRFLGKIGGQVGFGPVIGYVEEHTITRAAFYNVPKRTLYSASAGKGCYAIDSEFGRVLKKCPQINLKLKDCALIFFTGEGGEARIAQMLKQQGHIETAFRFGGFANDCSRLVDGCEEIQMQTTVRPWDFSAVLLTQEYGLETIVDPLGKPAPFPEWKLEINNPILTAPQNLISALHALIQAI
jgi:fructose-1,6-bisphosphatase/inositol monophosphatase family enzyme